MNYQLHSSELDQDNVVELLNLLIESKCIFPSILEAHKEGIDFQLTVEVAHGIDHDGHLDIESVEVETMAKFEDSFDVISYIRDFDSINEACSEGESLVFEGAK